MPLKVFIGVGSKEEVQFGDDWGMVKNAQELAARLRQHYSGADVDFSDFEGRSHGTVVVACFSQGIEMMLPVPPAVANH